MKMKTGNEDEDDDDDDAYILTQLPFLCVPSAHKTINQVTSLVCEEEIITFGDESDEDAAERTYS